jgi:peptide/nickel transport system ATP-binding protein
MTYQSVLAIDDLTVALPPGGDRALALRQVSLTVERGEVLCLVGESGSGKSVLAQAVLGLLPRDLKLEGGRIALEGEDISQASPQRLRALRAARMGIIFQEPMTALNPVMT